MQKQVELFMRGRLLFSFTFPSKR